MVRRFAGLAVFAYNEGRKIMRGKPLSSVGPVAICHWRRLIDIVLIKSIFKGKLKCVFFTTDRCFINLL